ncbi:CynX/NimT family MFS transporter [Tenuibacillus multivorans]|uniref:MFS transporter, CP family, cyanate transporter n=1 Tax=Tenuibacillus multivorans TaxID=237069 RepID=A0A1H0FK21_9BACI|nr:MFS transporter [Tenuibacillus multivorans]GEL77693.1 putative transporter YycB [Tenuibacillus multivorans]SDN94841.1 MFS transporter, CP family, cyanate transporter [Tenuibacillus multivorans]
MNALNESNDKIKQLLFIVGIIFVAFNLRPSITAVGPIISDIRLDTGMSNGLAGMLTTLPLIAFAVLSPLTPRLAQRIGNEWTVLGGLVLLGIGILIRPSDLIWLLFFGTLLVGAGIAICNVLLPGIVKQKFSTKVGLVTGIYTLSMSFMASMGSGVSVPLARGLGFGWKNSLVFWGILTVLAILVWIPQLRVKSGKLIEPDPTDRLMWKSKLAWQVTVFMGLQSLLFYCMIAWMPEILFSRGIDMSTAGWMVSIMQLVGLPSTLIAPYLADRLSNQRGIIMVMGVLYLIGIGFLLIGNHLLMLSLSILLIGIAQGASISLSLTFLSLRARNSRQAANLSGMAQSIGYFLAAVGPFAIGLIFDVFQSWNISIVILFAVCVIMTLAGIGAGRNEYVLPENGG